MTDRVRTYVFTVNNYTPQDIDLINNLVDKVTYLIAGKEVAPTTGTKHLQGFLRWKNAKTFSATKKLLPNGCHIECAIQDDHTNYNYCSKQEDYIELGTRPKPGKRNDLQQVKESIQKHIKIRELLDTNVIKNYQQLKFAESLNKYYERQRIDKPTVKWYWGSTGTGKTHTAYEEMRDLTESDNIYTAMDTGKWWEGYDAQEYIIIDDMRRDFMKFHQLLKLLDRYPYRVETKGSTRQFLGKYIIITSAYSPEDLYDTREDLAQLIRRIDVIRQFG